MSETIARIEDYSAPPAIKLVAFDDMRPRLGDGYLVKNLIGSSTMTVLYGEPGTGKTFLALHLALCVAAGDEFFGRRVRRAGVVYLAAEAGKSIENRVAAAKHEIEFPETMPFAAIETPLDLCAEEADTTPLIAAIRAADIGLPVELIIVDTLSRVLAGGNENQPDDMGGFVRNVDRIRAETGAAVLIVHHAGKDANRGARGHSLLRAAVDTEIEITRDDAIKVATARVTKQREYATDGALSFVLRQVELSIDSDGDPITSCLVEPSDNAPSSRPAKVSPTARLGYDQLLNCLADQPEELPPSRYIPAGQKGVTLDLWRGYLEKKGLVNPKGNPREQFKRIHVTLQRAGIIGVWEPYVWLSQPVT